MPKPPQGYAGAHGGGNHAGTDILTLGSGGLCLDDGAHQGVEVLLQLLGAEGNLADGAVDDVGLVQTVLDLTGLRLGEQRLATSGVTVPALGLGIRPRGPRTLPRRPTTPIMSGVATTTSKSIQFSFWIFCIMSISADIVSAGSLGSLGLVALGEYQHADGLAGAVGQNDGAADLLVSVTGVNAQRTWISTVSSNLALRSCRPAPEPRRVVQEQCCRSALVLSCIFLAMFHFIILLCGDAECFLPLLRGV